VESIEGTPETVDSGERADVRRPGEHRADGNATLQIDGKKKFRATFSARQVPNGAKDFDGKCLPA